MPQACNVLPVACHSSGNVELGPLATPATIEQATIPDEVAILRNAIARRTARVGIIGLGYVGLPLSRTFVAGGFHVLGFDLDAAKVASLQRGESYIGNFPASSLAAMREANRFEATDHFERLAEVDAIIICVPTPLTKTREPDLSLRHQRRPGRGILP